MSFYFQDFFPTFAFFELFPDELVDSLPFFTKDSKRGTSCKQRWRSHVTAGSRPANFIRIRLPLISHLARLHRFWPF